MSWIPQPGIGGKFEAEATGTALKEIVGVASIDGIGNTVDTHDKTHLQSTDKTATHVRGKVTPNPLTVTIHWDPTDDTDDTANHKVIWEANRLGTGIDWKYTFADGASNYSGSDASVTNLSVAAGVDGQLEATFTLTPNGPIVWDDGTP